MQQNSIDKSQVRIVSLYYPNILVVQTLKLSFIRVNAAYHLHVTRQQRLLDKSLSYV